MVRPRSISLEPDEMIALGEEMVAWVNENKPMHMSKWYSQHKKFLFSEWDTMTQKTEFLPYYEQAMSIIGEQYLDKDSKIREGASQRWQRVYFKDLRREEDETARFKASLAKEIVESGKVTPAEAVEVVKQLCKEKNGS